MKLKDLKEWGGRDLPGFGDEATWGGRKPHGDDDGDRTDIRDYLKSDYTETTDLDPDCFFLDPGEFGSNDDEAEILKCLKNLGIKVQNDTGHPFAAAFKHAFKPVWNFCCDGPDRWVKDEYIPQLRELCASAGQEFTITQLQSLSKKWLEIVESGPTTLGEIKDYLNDY